MTDKTIRSLVNDLNANQKKYIFYLRPLSLSVDFAKVWLKPPSLSNHVPDPDKFYFIKNRDGLYVAAVYDMHTNLHWFVLSKYRRRGFLADAMKKTILFHLFQDRSEQVITIDKEFITKKNFISSESLALSLGFIKIGDISYSLKREAYQTEYLIEGLNTFMTKQRMNELQSQLNCLTHSLWLIQTETEMKFGVTQFTSDLNKLVNKVKENTWRIEDAWYDNQNKLSTLTQRSL